MNIIRCNIGAVLGIFGGILGVLNASRPLLNNLFWGYFTEYVAWGLAIMISCSAMIGAVLALKGKLILGGYLMLLTSLIWAISLPLQFVLPSSGMMGIMNSIFFTLYTLGGSGPILSLIGGVLILLANNKSIEVAKVKREQEHGEIGMESSSETDKEKQKAKALKQTKILIRISALILILTLTVIGIMWYIVATA